MRPESDRERIKRTIREQITSGALTPGQRIPSAAELARQHGVHQRTAANALFELRRDGAIYARQGHGYFVAGADPEPGRAPTLSEVLDRLDRIEERLGRLERGTD